MPSQWVYTVYSSWLWCALAPQNLMSPSGWLCACSHFVFFHRWPPCSPIQAMEDVRRLLFMDCILNSWAWWFSLAGMGRVLCTETQWETLCIVHRCSTSWKSSPRNFKLHTHLSLQENFITEVILCCTSYGDLLYIVGNTKHNLGPDWMDENKIYTGGVSCGPLLRMAQISIRTLTVNAAQHAFPQWCKLLKWFPCTTCFMHFFPEIIEESFYVFN